MKKQIIISLLVLLGIFIYGKTGDLKNGTEVKKEKAIINKELKQDFFYISNVEKYIIENYPNDYMRYKIIETQVKENVEEISFGVINNLKDEDIFVVKATPKKNKTKNLEMYILLFFDLKDKYLELKSEYSRLIDKDLNISSIYAKLDEKGNYLFCTDKDILNEDIIVEEKLIRIKFDKKTEK